MILVWFMSLTLAAMPAVAYSDQAKDVELCSGFDGCEEAGYANHNYEASYKNTYWRAFAGHNCTNYASYMMATLGATAPDGLMGNGADWHKSSVETYKIASAVDVPSRGVIAQWNANSGFAGGAGHVAFVERVTSSFIVTSEDNYGGSFKWRKIYRDSVNWPSHFLRFYGVQTSRYHRNLNGGGGDDVLLYGPGSARDVALYGSDNHDHVFMANDVDVNGRYDQVVKGDFNGDAFADLLFYGKGDEHDAIWYGSATRGVFDRAKELSVQGNYDIVLAGDFNCDGKSDVLWYGQGTRKDALWFGSSAKGSWSKAVDVEVDGRYTPVVGDFNADKCFDVLWYRPDGSGSGLWYGSRTKGEWSTRSLTISGGYIPVVGDFNGTGKDDVLWYGRGTKRDSMWFGSGDTSKMFAKGYDISVDGSGYQPVAGDFDADGRDDVLWYTPGGGDDSIWWSTEKKGVFDTAAFSIDGVYKPA